MVILSTWWFLLTTSQWASCWVVLPWALTWDVGPAKGWPPSPHTAGWASDCLCRKHHIWVINLLTLLIRPEVFEAALERNKNKIQSVSPEQVTPYIPKEVSLRLEVSAYPLLSIPLIATIYPPTPFSIVCVFLNTVFYHSYSYLWCDLLLKRVPVFTNQRTSKENSREQTCPKEFPKNLESPQLSVTCTNFRIKLQF